MRKAALLCVLVLVIVLGVMPINAQEDEIPPAEIVNDEGGAVHITGTWTISSQNVIDAVQRPLIILEDQAGFVDRNLDYVLPPESQVIAAPTSPYQVGEMTYSLSLPARPQGGFRDVDNDGREDTGVQVFQVGAWGDSYGTNLVDEYDGTGWSTGFSSARTSINPETNYEYIGGKIIVWSPDDQQGFPSGFGEDGLLFTEDDPIVLLPAGYTMVDMDTDPFTFDRSAELVIDLIEPDSFIPNDFSEMSYAEAFNALVDVAINEYAFTEMKGIDWEALREEFLPRFEAADANNDNAAYLFALRDFAWSIPDGHVALYGPQDPLTLDFLNATSGGLGLAPVEFDDGRFVVGFLLEGGPAAEAGIELLAELIEINGTPIEEALESVVPYSSPFSKPAFERVQKLRYLFAFPVGTEIELTYRNPDDTESTTVTLTAIEERESFGFSSVNRGRTFREPQIAYEFLENDIAYVQIVDFGGDEILLVETWEEMLESVQQFGSPAIIIDLRYNDGGFSSIAARLASYFFHERAPVYYSEEYNPEIDAFYLDENFPTEIIPPLNESLIYDGPVIVLTGQACASACEFFAYILDYQDRSTFIGHYGTQGIAGGWPLLFMPDDITFALPTGRDRDPEGNIILEGVGIEPDVKVPVDEDFVLRADEDLVLEAALNYIEEATSVNIEDGGTIVIGDTVEGEIAERTRVQYTLEITEDVTLDFIVEDPTGELDTYLRVYVSGNDTPAIENDDVSDETVNSGLTGIDIPGGLTLIVEVAGFNDEQAGPFSLTIQETAEGTDT